MQSLIVAKIVITRNRFNLMCTQKYCFVYCLYMNMYIVVKCGDFIPKNGLLVMVSAAITNTL